MFALYQPRGLLSSGMAPTRAAAKLLTEQTYRAFCHSPNARNRNLLHSRMRAENRKSQRRTVKDHQARRPMTSSSIEAS